MSYAPFVRLGTRHHPEIDLPRLTEHLGHDGEFDDHITSPEHLASWEKRRARLAVRTPRAQAADLFVWAVGEAPERRSTRVGGTPYLPRGMDWPRFDGEPATFLAQFDFGDSRDLFPRLPGDLMLIFVKDEDYRFGEAEQFQYLWLQTPLENLISADDCPAPGWEFVTCHGIRHRTHDDPGLYDVLERESGDGEIELGVPVAEATKIGGALYDPQDVDPEMPSGARLLCALSSIQAIPGRPWPWANREAALDSGFGEEGIHHPANELMISDMGTLHFLLDARGQVEVHAGSY